MVIHTSEVFVWLPREFTPNWKVEITKVSDGTVTDISKRIYYARFAKVIFSVGIGDFKIKIPNTDGTYSNMWTGGDTVEFYADMAGATRKQFTGRIDYIKEEGDEKGNFLIIEGRHASYLLTETWVIKQYQDQNNDAITKNLVDSFLTGYTYGNVDSFTNSLTKSWVNKSLIDCMRDLCNSGVCDGYVDNDLDFHLFAENSILNTDEAVVEGQNFLTIKDFGKDTYYEKDKVTVYGEDDEGLPIIYTAGSGNRAKPPVIDKSIDSMEQAQEVADSTQAEATGVPNQGTVVSRGLPTLEPGENIWFSIPSREIHGIYKVIEVAHIVGRETKSRWNTECRLERESKSIEYQLSKRARKEFEIAKIANIYNLEFSYNFTFDDDSNIGQHSNTKVENGALILTAGQTSGTMTSTTKTTLGNISQVQLKYRGENLEDTTFEVSVNDGTNWEYITKDELLSVGFTGKSLKVRVNLAGTSAKVYSLAVLYK